MRKTNNHIGRMGYIQHRFCKSDEWSFRIWNRDILGYDSYSRGTIGNHKRFIV